MIRRLIQHPLSRQFIKFAFIGILNTGLDYGVFSLLTYGFQVNYLVANVISFSLAVSNSYLLNRRWTFASTNPQWRGEAIKFLIINLIGLGLNELLLFFFVDHFGWSKLVAKGVGVVIVLFWNFIGTRMWAFRRPPAGLPG